MALIPLKQAHNTTNVQTIGSVPCQKCDDIFGDESSAEKIAKQIQIADDLLAQFHTHINEKEFRQAEALIPDIVESGGGDVYALCEELECAHIKHTSIVREHLFDQIALALPKLDLFTGEVNTAGKREVTLVWRSSPDSKADSYCLVRKEFAAPSTVEDGVTIYKGIKDSFIDTTIPIGIPCYYSVFSCYRGRVNKTPNSLDAPIVYTPAIESLDACIEGCSKCAIATLTWTLPPYDEAADVSLVLTRDNKSIFVVNCNKCHTEKNAQTVETHGGEFVFFVPDGEVVEGAVYRYELTLTVSGKILRPIVREVAIAKLPELPKVTASCYYQKGRLRLDVEWPNGISEICLSSPGAKPITCKKEEYSAKPIYLYDVSVRQVEVQAVCRFGNKIAYGPKGQVKFKDSQRTLQVSIERTPRNVFAILKFWEKDLWGMKVRFDDGSSLPAINVAVENPGKSVRTFVIPVGDIKPDEFFPFPLDWDVKHGAIIDVSISDCNDLTDYLTSRKIS